MNNEERPIIDYETIDDVEKSSSKNPFKKKEKTKVVKEEKTKVEKNKKPKNTKKIIAISAIVLTFIAIFVALGYTLLKDDNENNVSTNNSDNTIDINSKPNGSGLTFATTSKLTLPERDPSMYTLSEATNKINEINKGIVSYFTEIKETVLSFKEGKTSDYNFEQDLLQYKNNILADIDMLAKYRVMYEGYNCFDLYSIQIKRLQNELDLIKSLASTMTDEALVSTFNNYVEKEKNLNNQMIYELRKYFDANGIQYEEKNGYITYL